jgi:hypothetical protein
MEYYIIDKNNQQIGPLTIEELKVYNILKSTKIWKQGMPDWVDAETVKELNVFFSSPPPIPSSIPPPIPSNIPPPIQNIHQTHEKTDVKLNVNETTFQNSNAKTGIEITTKHPITAYLYNLTKTFIVIDGVEKKMKWGKHFYEVREGEHTLNIYIPYVGMKINKNNSINFSITNGEIKKIKFNAPHIVTAKGKYKFLN